MTRRIEGDQIELGFDAFDLTEFILTNRDASWTAFLLQHDIDPRLPHVDWHSIDGRRHVRGTSLRLSALRGVA